MDSMLLQGRHHRTQQETSNRQHAPDRLCGASVTEGAWGTVSGQKTANGRTTARAGSFLLCAPIGAGMPSDKNTSGLLLLLLTPPRGLQPVHL
jgi:hypothetical protein